MLSREWLLFRLMNDEIETLVCWFFFHENVINFGCVCRFFWAQKNEQLDRLYYNVDLRVDRSRQKETDRQTESKEEEKERER